VKRIFLLAVFSSLYASDALYYYTHGEYEKAKKELLKLNSYPAKAYLAKTYFKLGEYDNSKKLIVSLMDKNIPKNVKEELKTYLDYLSDEKKLSAEISAGLLYDSNINLAKEDGEKKDDLAHIEEAKIDAFYRHYNISFGLNAKFQNRGYIKNSKYNRIYSDISAYANYDSFISAKAVFNFQNTTFDGALEYGLDTDFYKKFGQYSAGLFALAKKYDNIYDLDSYGGGVFAKAEKENFKTEIRLSYYYSSCDLNSSYSSNNLKAQIKYGWKFSKVNVDINYYYNLALYDSKRENMHYLDTAFTTKESKHVYYSLGFTNYFQQASSNDDKLRKYEIYMKFIYSF